MSYLHYKNYHKQRLEQMPTRNLPTRIAYPLLGTVLDVAWNTSKEDSELNEFRYKVASVEAKLKAAELQRDIYSRVVKWPVHVREQNIYYHGKPTDAYTSYNWHGTGGDHKSMSWQERFETIQSEWQRVKGEDDGYVDSRGRGGNVGKRLARKEFEYMTTGDGYVEFLREMAEGIRKEFIPEFFEGYKTIGGVLSRENDRANAAAHKLAKAAGNLELRSRAPYRSEEKVPFLSYDPTSDIDNLRKLNKKMKDTRVDRDFFFEAFGCKYSDSTLACHFTNSVDNIKEANPYLEKRLRWEARIQEFRDILSNFESEIVLLKQQLEELGTEEDFQKIQDQRDIRFRQRFERKKALKQSIEDRAESVVDAAELAAAELKMNLIKKTRKGHGQVSSAGKEKHAHLTVDEALDAQTAQWQTKKRALEVYKVPVSVSYTKWDSDYRRRYEHCLTQDFWFLRKLRA